MSEQLTDYRVWGGTRGLGSAPSYLYTNKKYIYTYTSVAILAQSQFRLRFLVRNKFKLHMTKGPPRLQAETYTQKNQNSKLRIIKIGPVQLELEPSDCSLVKEWHHSETMNPIRFRRFCGLVVRAYKDWCSVVHINNKIVKKKATSIDASSATLSQS